MFPTITELPVPPEAYTTPICPFFNTCGGCDTQDITYSRQTVQKDLWLTSLFSSIATKHLWKPFIHSTSKYPTYFRGKIRFGFVQNEGTICPSRHAKGEEDAEIAVDACYLQSELSVAISLFTAQFATTHSWRIFNSKISSGWLKHILIREGKQTGECLVSLVTTQMVPPHLQEWVGEICKRFPQVKSVYHTVTQGQNNELSQDFHLAGETHITERVGECLFYISPHAFFQTNGLMVQTLYDAIMNMSTITSTSTVWDLYAGSATIGIYLSNLAKDVISIESNPDNCRDAAKNCIANSVTNLTMYEGQVDKILTSTFITSHSSPSIIIVDPPRAGLSSSLKNILPNLKNHSLVYVSCNPVTCLRDCQQLIERGYVVETLQGIDMFPHSYHSEMIIRLTNRNTISKS